MEIYSQLNEIIKKKMGFVRPSNSNDLNLRNDLGMDSLDLVELTILSEQQFNITITDDEAISIQTISELHKLLEMKLSN